MAASAYWARRAEARMDAYLMDTEGALETIRRAHDQATHYLQTEAERLFLKYADDYDLDIEEANELLSQPVTRSQYKRLLEQIASIPDEEMRKPLHAKASSGAYSYRIQRLDALRDTINAQATRLRAIEQSAFGKLFPLTIQDAYYRTIFDLQKGTGYAFSFNKIGSGPIREILQNPWSGKHFSQRIWTNTNALADTLNETITASFLSGRSNASLAQEIAERMDVSYREAERLVRTETTYMANAAEMQCYRECGVERYQYLATLDMLTSDACQALDGQIFLVSEAVPGTNMPPLHPNCRSTTVVVLDSMTRENLKRGALDPQTGEAILIPRDMTYPEWRKKYVDAA